MSPLPSDRQVFQQTSGEAPSPPTPPLRRYCKTHPRVTAADVLAVLSYQLQHFRWAGCDVFTAVDIDGNRKSVVVETNSCASGQKSTPWLRDDDEQNGYKRLGGWARRDALDPRGRRHAEPRSAVHSAFAEMLDAATAAVPPPVPLPPAPPPSVSPADAGAACASCGRPHAPAAVVPGGGGAGGLPPPAAAAAVAGTPTKPPTPAPRATTPALPPQPSPSPPPLLHVPFAESSAVSARRGSHVSARTSDGAGGGGARGGDGAASPPLAPPVLAVIYDKNVTEASGERRGREGE